MKLFPDWLCSLAAAAALLGCAGGASALPLPPGTPPAVAAALAMPSAVRQARALLAAGRPSKAVEAWMAAERFGLPATMREPLTRGLLEAAARLPADALLLRLAEPGLLGAPVATMHATLAGTPSVARAAGAWALQPDSQESRDRLRWWLELADEHSFELQGEYPIPGCLPPSPGLQRALLRLAAGRLEFLAGRRRAALACERRAREDGAPDALARLVGAPRVFEPMAAMARQALAEGRADEAVALYRAAGASANCDRDGTSEVIALLDEASRAFPLDPEIERQHKYLRMACGMAMPKRAWGWALAGVQALRRGEAGEAAARMGAALRLIEALQPGPADPAPWFNAMRLWSAAQVSSDGDPARSLEILATGVGAVPGRLLMSVDVGEAFRHAVARRWAERAGELDDPRVLARQFSGPGRPGEGLAVYAGHLLRRERFLEAEEALLEVASLASGAHGEQLGRRVMELQEEARHGVLKSEPDLEALVRLREAGAAAPLEASVDQRARRRVALLLASGRRSDAAALVKTLAALTAGGTIAAPEQQTEPREEPSRLIGLLNRRAYAELSLELQKPPAPAPAGDSAASPLGDSPAGGGDPLAGLKAGDTVARAMPGSPYGGPLSRWARATYRSLLLGILLFAWTRLHLFLLAIFLPGGPFFGWLARKGP